MWRVRWSKHQWATLGSLHELALIPLPLLPQQRSSGRRSWSSLCGRSTLRVDCPRHTALHVADQGGNPRIVKARTVHGAYGAEMRELHRLMRALDEEQRRVLKLVT